MKNSLAKWGKVVAGNKTRWLTVIVWVLLVGVLSMVWPNVQNEKTGSNNLLPNDVMSEQATKISKEQFPNDAGVPLLIVWHRQDGLQGTDYEMIQSLYKELKKAPLDEQKMVPEFDKMPVDILKQSASGDGEAIVTPLFFDENASTDELRESLRVLEKRITKLTKTDPFATDISETGLHIRYTGPVGIQTDTVKLFSQADVKLLIATVLLVLVLLIVLYRSPILAVVPLIGVGFAYGLVSPMLGFMANKGWIVVDAQAISIMTVLLFGAGTDYCLFLIAKYRDELQLEVNKYKALQLAIANSGGAIMMSALTTVIGLLSLSLAQYASYHRFAVPFALAIFIMAIVVMTLLPAFLSMLGRVAFYPFIPRTEKMVAELEAQKGKPIRFTKKQSRYKNKAGHLVTQKPWLIIISCLVLLGAFAAFVPKIEYTYGLLESFPEDMPSREGYAIISEHYSVGENAPMQVIVDTEGKATNVEKVLSEQSIVDKVSKGQQGEKNPDFVEYSLTLAIDPYSAEAVEKVPEIKNVTADALKKAGIENTSEHVWLGGETVTLYDTKATTSHDQQLIIPVVLIIMAVLLLGYLRSIPAMVYLLTTVVISFLTALGLGWLIIHYVMGEAAIQGLIPLYSFVFLVALGGDYNIFMISGIWRKSKEMPLKQAISEGVRETGHVISSAGLILAGTFLVLAVLPMQVLVQFGIVTAIGVLLDTFIVRPLLVPAITFVLGKYAFWPGKLWKKVAAEKSSSSQ